MSLKVKYWKGWLRSFNMNEKGYLNQWFNSALEAEKEDCELVVFKIPKNKTGTMSDPETIEHVEEFLQRKFG